MLMACLLTSVPMCWGTAKHVMPQCGVGAHIADIVLVAQISIFSQTMKAWVRGGGRSGGVCTKKVSGGDIFTVLIRVTKNTE